MGSDLVEYALVVAVHRVTVRGKVPRIVFADKKRESVVLVATGEKKSGEKRRQERAGEKPFALATEARVGRESED
jgi:hypothetical protein